MNDPRTALRLDEAAQAIHPDSETSAALVHSMLTTPYAGILPTPAGETEQLLRSAATKSLLASAGVAADGATTVVSLWDVSDPAAAREQGTVPIANPVTGIALTPDGTVLATGSERGFVLWDVANPAAPRQLSGPLDPTVNVETLEFGDDGKKLSILARGKDQGYGNTVSVWDTTDPTSPQPFTAFTSPVPITRIATASRGTVLVTAGIDRSVSTWDLAVPPRVPQRQKFSTSASTTRSTSVELALTPDGHTLATSGSDNTIMMWDVTNAAAPRQFEPPLPAGTLAVDDLAFSADGSALAAAAMDNSVTLWDTRDPAERSVA